LKNGICELECDEKFGISGCSMCTEKKCIECSGKECCGSVLKHYWNATTNKCVDPAEALGEGCLESDGEKCTVCTSQSCCKEDEYFDYGESICKSCTDFGDVCAHCTNGGCSDCGSDEGITIDPEGKCANCSSLFGDGCSECDKMKCTRVKDGFVMIGVKAVKCSSLFGDGCDKCNGNGCTSCSDKLVSINGYCRSCGEVFGESCTSCTSKECTRCDKQSETVLVNGACVNCGQAYGKGCKICDNVTGCSRTELGYFIAKHFSFICEVLPTKELRDFCTNDHSNTRQLAGREGKTSGEASDKISIKYKDTDVEVSCSDMTANCSLCSDADGQAKCTECRSGFYLVGWTCKSCSEQFPAGNCAECNSNGCTKCNSASMNVGVNGNCVSCVEEKQVFSSSSRTCVDCSTVFSRCSKCNTDMCTSCESENYLHNETTGECLTCSEVHGTGCTSCDNDHCNSCIDIDCCEDGDKIISVPGKKPTCGKCRDFNENCSECTATTCTKCKDGMFFDKDEGVCVRCSDVFAECGECNADQCTECNDPDTTKWILTPNGCIVNDTVVIPSSDSSQSHSSSLPIHPPSSSNDEVDVGMIVGIVLGCFAFVAIIIVAVVCYVTRGPKHKKNKGFYLFSDAVAAEADGVSMSIL